MSFPFFFLKISLNLTATAANMREMLNFHINFLRQLFFFPH